MWTFNPADILWELELDYPGHRRETLAEVARLVSAFWPFPVCDTRDFLDICKEVLNEEDDEQQWLITEETPPGQVPRGRIREIVVARELDIMPRIYAEVLSDQRFDGSRGGLLTAVAAVLNGLCRQDAASGPALRTQDMPNRIRTFVNLYFSNASQAGPGGAST